MVFNGMILMAINGKICRGIIVLINDYLSCLLYKSIVRIAHSILVAIRLVLASHCYQSVISMFDHMRAISNRFLDQTSPVVSTPRGTVIISGEG